MKIFKCENCKSIFIPNGYDRRIKNGEYSIIKDIFVCPICQYDLMPLVGNNTEEDYNIRN
jgi:rubredoxin